MLKSVLISINLIGFICLPYLYVGNVTVDHKPPTEMISGGEEVVEIILNKGGVTGPARLKIDFSQADGLFVEEVSSNGASFSFTNGQLLYIWYAIPDEEQITVKYKIIAEGAAKGTKTLSGSFSYLEGDDRQTVVIPASTIEVKDAEDVVVFIDSNTPDTTSNNTTDNNTTDNNTVENTNPVGVGEVKTKRTISPDGDNYIVRVSVYKGTESGFGRIKEIIPEGFKVEKIQANKAIFRFSDNQVKFLWTSLPEDDYAWVTYRLIPTTAQDGVFNITGVFSAEFMIKDDKAESVDVAASTFRIGEEPTDNNTTDNNTTDNNTTDNNTTDNNTTDNNTTDNNTTDNNTTDNNTTDNNTTDNNTTDNNTTDNNTTDNNTTDNNTTDNTTTVVNNSNTNISYRVQISAGHKNVSTRYFKKKGVSGDISMESHEGWIKYTVGGYNAYKRAKEKREKLSRLDLRGPFVTAYNLGDRVTVQEALVISNQKWIR